MRKDPWKLRKIASASLLLVAGIAYAETGTIRVDFGRNNGVDGAVTESPDGNGAYWNNLGLAEFDQPTGLAAVNLVETDGTPTPLAVTCSAGIWRSNGILNGGLLAPEETWLGDLAIASATQDYFFVETGSGGGGTGSLTISGLKPDRRYQFRFFGTRNTTDIRRSLYTVTAASGVQSQELQTSGSGSGSASYPNGNDDTILQFDGIQADSNGSVEVTLTVAEGAYAYLGLMEIVEGEEVPVIDGDVPADLATWVTQDGLDDPGQGAVLFVGSSSIRRWESVTRDFADYRVLQRGWGGSWLADMDTTIPHLVKPYQPSAIVMWAGTNDLSGGRTGEEVHEDFRTFLMLLRRELPEVPFLYLGVTRTPANDGTKDARLTANALIEATAETDPHTYFVDLPSIFEDLTTQELDDLYVDPIHLNRAGYAKWLEVVRPALEAVVDPNQPIYDGESLEREWVAGDRMLFDFGPDDVLELDGHDTASPDVRGHYWNNWYTLNGGVGINSGEHKRGIVTTDGSATGVRWVITGGYAVNGRRNGGLFGGNGPSEALLGDLAVETATEDYFYSTADDLDDGGSDDVPGGFMFSGLDPDFSYEFRIFATRETSDVRSTEYAIYGTERQAATLQTSGPSIGSNGTYAGNDDEVVVISGVRPDAYGQVFIDMLSVAGGFAYIGAMEVVVSAADAPPGLVTWRAAHFSEAELADAELEASLWGNGADPDGDGRSNLWEYATGTDPRSQEANPVTTEWADGTFRVRFPRNVEATDVVLGVEGSTDLVEWQTMTDVVEASEPPLEWRAVEISTDGESRQFLRLTVEEQP
ncbi:hypothetical protein HNR46_000427 [Haloferula luteola]|uniref:SGNH hydrolase-type esterase domain-containing protein n=1 Tax=Haloferula luteola TaxID=595692 RepID=A0A840UYX3_9BACT|nr:GDSL-type esterase/lipase family protein [Haloferula luteola]MBB5350203.1 hypothetical protein [Haloferula luteola]